MFIIVLLLIAIPAILLLVEFLYFTISGEQVLSRQLFNAVELWNVVLLPLLFLTVGDETKNDCCSDSAFFSPEHRLSMLSLIVLCWAAFLYSRWRSLLAPPLLEVAVNCLLLIGIGLNILMMIHHSDELLHLFHLPVIVHFIYALVQNQRLFMEEAGLDENYRQGFSASVLRLPAFVKYPILLLLCLPLIVVLSTILLLFGQRPDSMIRAFTDTYKHGFSQLDYECKEVVCPQGHFLCSVAAKGHPELVKPLRPGMRGGVAILCNRQLLVSNAFEELLAEKVPFIHGQIRRQYNKIGSLIHQYYGIFNHKWVSNIIYILMKPLECFFLLTLYTFDRKPENRIGRQYLGNR
ncbi:DUF6688 family protein [Pedobacter sp. SYSU D00535]|uniref:DUF6688 domain-containing protein n=1 Tax=Pedobacter sp. SYSU D00535 TaxID=2810308 RepID=UPI001A961773|nr:DUF6688 family protein [Pedobacter sp. SYSU D00535]